MFQYEYEKRPPSSSSCDSRATATTEWSRSSSSARQPPVDRSAAARRPLPPRPMSCDRIPDKTSVPLKVWIIASASCFAVCASLVLATVVITKWGTSGDFTETEFYADAPEPIRSAKTLISPKIPIHRQQATADDPLSIDNDIPVLEKLSIFKNYVANRDHTNLISKPQLHPVHDVIDHEDRNIKKKDKADLTGAQKVPNADQTVPNSYQKVPNMYQSVPNFKPTLPDLVNKDFEMLPYGYMDLTKDDYYYNDENLYDDYIQSTSLTNYLIEKIQELHDWIVTDPDINTKKSTKNHFSDVLRALNDSLSEGNVTIIIDKLKDVYFGENYPTTNGSKVLLGNTTDLVSFGILTLDVMLLHNIQLMAWENQESARIKMLKDPDVFAFNALFLESNKVEAKQNEVQHDGSIFLKRLNPRQDLVDDMSIGQNLLENILEVGMSTARAAIHLGRAFKNTKNILNQLSNKDLNTNIQNQISRNIDGNTHALNRLQTSFDSSSVASANTTFYTELDCVWLLYCRNLVATAKLHAPYGTMARINGVALRMLTGELSADRALDTMLYEILTGWSDLKCNDMFPRCSKVDAAAVVMDSILQPHKKSQTSNAGR